MFLENMQSKLPETDLADAETFMRQSLGLLAEQLKTHRHEGYPGLGNRFRGIKHTLTEAGRMELSADDPWNVGQILPTDEEIIDIADMGYRTDSQGRPKHPWYGKMAADVAIGVVMGKGFYRYWGPNYTADSVVIQNGHVLLIERRDSGLYAVTGGHRDPDETTGELEDSLHAGIREVGEEADLDLNGRGSPVQIHQGPVVDIRMTANAWPETTAFLFDLGDDPNLPPVKGGDDAKKAGWKPLEVARQLPMHGSHKLFIEQVLEML